MNKQEIEKELVRARVAETTIKNNIIELLEQLVEVEKPKLRHGDFGYSEAGDICLALYAQNAKAMRRASASYLYERNIHSSNFELTNIFGNIFDLLKEWGEDLEEWGSEDGKEGESIKMSLRDCSDNKIWFGTCGNSDYYKLEVIEEIWHKLGQMIATLKRKMAK